MKRNSYILSGNFLIKDSLPSYLLYFDYFLSQGLPLTQIFKINFLRRLVYLSLRIGVILMYVFKLYKFRYKLLSLNEDALIVFKGPGIWSSTIKLIEKNNKLKIQKKVFSREIFLKEKKFYTYYKNTKSNIRLPKHKFKKDNIIEIEFLQFKTFQRLIVDGTFNLNTSLKHFAIIKNELKRFYGKKITLIHGDLGLANIFINNNKYYLIDFTDSHINDYYYDLYILLSYILKYHHLIEKTSHIKQTIDNYDLNRYSLSKFMGINFKELEKFENQHNAYKKERFPHLYSN